jgi:ribosome-associated translation inhibitor RaiA
MNVDIQTEHVTMRPEWHRAIDEWLGRCARQHPETRVLDVTLRHDQDAGTAPEEAEVLVTVNGRTLRAARHAELMSLAIRDALAAIESELLVHEAVGRRVRASR